MQEKTLKIRLSDDDWELVKFMAKKHKCKITEELENLFWDSLLKNRYIYGHAFRKDKEVNGQR